jgi:hypothetical protein
MEDASLPLIEPPSSPPLPAQPSRRKRTRLTFNHDQYTTSDPPLFSSDPPDPSVDHYFQPRRKRQYRGTWWGPDPDAVHNSDSEHKSKADFARNLDSGVWMGSDNTDESLGSDDVAPESSQNCFERTTRPVPVARNSPEEVARRIVQQSLDHEQEVVDLRYLYSVFGVFNGQCVYEKAEKWVPTAILNATYCHMFKELAGDTWFQFFSHILMHASIILAKYFFVYMGVNFSSNLNLQTISNELLTPLKTLTKRPRYLDINASPRDTDFHPLQPQLQMFLSGNSLRALPSELFSLENISVLSLRTNNLELLSPHVSKLHNLIELNLAGNGLRFLPYELLTVIRSRKLQSLTVLPNPLLRPFRFQGFLDHETPIPGLFEQPRSKEDLEESIKSLEMQQKEIREFLSEHRRNGAEETDPDIAAGNLDLEHHSWMLQLSRGYMQASRELLSSVLGKGEGLRDVPEVVDSYWDYLSEQGASECDLWRTPIFVASTPVVRFNSDGSLPRGISQSTPPSQLSPDTATLPAIPGGAPIANIGTRVPSLFELATSSAASVPEVPILHTLLPDDAPRPVTRALQAACQAREEGGRVCGVCGRNYTIVRTEWVEYWHLPPKYGTRSSRDEMFWPFLRRGCSLGCVPDRSS